MNVLLKSIAINEEDVTVDVARHIFICSFCHKFIELVVPEPPETGIHPVTCPHCGQVFNIEIEQVIYYRFLKL